MNDRSRRGRNILATALALGGALLFAPGAFANGRFPRAQRLIESATDTKLLALYGTYGLIVSRDGGVSWNHVCEAATGTYTGEDPLLEILPDGKIVANAQSALVRSGGSWCDWNSILDGSVNAVQDITRSQTDPLSILAVLGSYDRARGFSSQFVQSSDGGTTWSTATSLPVIVRGLSIDVAPSSQKRVVVSGLDAAGAGNLLVSDDGGATWQGKPLPMTDTGSAPYLAAISKSDPNRLFVRTDASTTINGTNTANDALLLTLDGGSSWTTLIQRNAKLFGFALSPDESTLLAGYGDPVTTQTYVAPGDLGIYRADVATIVSDVAHASTHFEKIFGASVTCLRWTPTGLFACTSQTALGFEVGRAPDATFTLSDANPFTPLLQLSKVRPLPCAQGTRGYACYSDPINGFASVCGLFQTPCDASAPPPMAPSRDAGVDASVATEAGLDGAAGPAVVPTKPGTTVSCACRSARSRSADSSARLLALALLVALRTRRARRSLARQRRV
jgi:photosystem II stability/assembly factor-like uncharacterized protein